MKNAKIVVLMLLVFAGLAVPVAPAIAAPTSTSALFGPAEFGASCAVSQLSNSTKYGRANLQATSIAGDYGFGNLNIGVSTNGLASRTTYHVVIADLLVDNGTVLGCSYISAGTFRTNGAGSGRFNSSMNQGIGDHNLQVLVTANYPIPFLSLVYATKITPVSVPSGV